MYEDEGDQRVPDDTPVTRRSAGWLGPGIDINVTQGAERFDIDALVRQDPFVQRIPSSQFT